MKRFWIFVAILLAALLPLGCAPAPSGNYKEGSYLTGKTLQETGAGQTGDWIEIRVEKEHQPVGVLARGSLKEGSLYLLLTDANGKTVWRSNPASGAGFKIEATVENLPPGDYRLLAAWDGPVGGTIDLFINPSEPVTLPAPRPTVLLGSSGMILVAAAYVIYAATRRLGWKYLGLGALAWVVTVAIKFGLAIPLNPLVYKALVDPGQVFGASPGIGKSIFYLYVGLLTGVTEVLLVWLLVRYSRIGKCTWQKVLAFGIGFGAVEAFLLGVSGLGGTLAGLLNPDVLPLNALESLAAASDIRYGLAPISERFFTVLVHLLSNVLIFYGAAMRKPGYFWLAFAYKSAIDTVAAYAQLTGLDTLGKIWIIEAVVILWGIVGWLGTLWVQKRYPEPATPLEGANVSRETPIS